LFVQRVYRHWIANTVLEVCKDFQN
jgi:hypothetical protein